MNYQMRLATHEDIEALYAIKTSLKLADQSKQVKGGFLLGSSFEEYKTYVDVGAVYVIAFKEKQVVAFSIVFSDELLRQSKVFQKRQQANIPSQLMAQLEPSRIAYYEQLAVLPHHRCVGAYLALRHLLDICQNHDYVLTTLVYKPITNIASLPYLKAMGFKPIGQIDEVYPDIGDIVSTIYLSSKSTIEQNCQKPFLLSLQSKLERNWGTSVPLYQRVTKNAVSKSY